MTATKQLGDIFRSRREELKLSIKEVASAISIRPGYLEAIEGGEAIPSLSPVYVAGFTRQYARFLELDIEKLSRDHPVFFTSGSETHEFSYGIGTLEARKSLSGGVKWFPYLVRIGIVIAFVTVAYMFAKLLGLV